MNTTTTLLYPPKGSLLRLGAGPLHHTAVVLDGGRVLEVKRDGNRCHSHFETIEEWQAATGVDPSVDYRVEERETKASVNQHAEEQTDEGGIRYYPWDQLNPAEQVQWKADTFMTQLLLDRQGRSSSVEAKLQSTMRLYEFLLTNHLLLASTPGLRSKTVQSICDMESMARELYMAEEGVEDFLELARAFREFVRGPLMEHPRWFE